MIILQPEHQLYTNSMDFLLYQQPIATSKPNSQIHKFTNNYMLNSILELYNLKLEKVNPTLTLD